MKKPNEYTVKFEVHVIADAVKEQEKKYEACSPEEAVIFTKREFAVKKIIEVKCTKDNSSKQLNIF